MKQRRDSIMPQTIRQTILDFLQERLENDDKYKLAKKGLANAEKSNDIDEIQTAKNQLAEIAKEFEFTHWMEQALTIRISRLTRATHVSKGIHPSSKGSNCNYTIQSKQPIDFAVSSSTVIDLPYDVGIRNACDLVVFTLLNKKVNDDVTLLQLIIDRHPAIMPALADDASQAKRYLANIQTFLQVNWQHPQASELNKQLYWPMSEEAYLSAADNQYRLLVPLHPSSLCHVVFQKIQSRFSEENKQALKDRFKKGSEHQAYFTYPDLAVVKLGGSNPRNASVLIHRQKGNNFLLPSIPPKIHISNVFQLKKSAKSIFSLALRDRCWEGFNALFMVIDAENGFEVRDSRKEALDIILAILFGIVKEMQLTRFPGWSREYKLDMAQKCWLDPGRNDIPGDDEFQQYYQTDWLSALEKQFAGWINTMLKKRFRERAADFKDAEFGEWHREFGQAVKLSLRNNEGIF